MMIDNHSTIITTVTITLSRDETKQYYDAERRGELFDCIRKSTESAERVWVHDADGWLILVLDDHREIYSRRTIEYQALDTRWVADVIVEP